MSFVLFILAFILVVCSSFIGIIGTIIKSVIYWNQGILNTYFFKLAISLDQFGNVCCGPLLNYILISKESKHKFGDPDETISSVLGKNKKNDTLIYWGLRLDALLDGLDENHSINSIEN